MILFLVNLMFYITFSLKRTLSVECTTTMWTFIVCSVTNGETQCAYCENKCIL